MRAFNDGRWLETEVELADGVGVIGWMRGPFAQIDASQDLCARCQTANANRTCGIR
jgi:hypothetical protein